MRYIITFVIFIVTLVPLSGQYYLSYWDWESRAQVIKEMREQRSAQKDRAKWLKDYFRKLFPKQKDIPDFDSISSADAQRKFYEGFRNEGLTMVDAEEAVKDLDIN